MSQYHVETLKFISRNAISRTADPAGPQRAGQVARGHRRLRQHHHHHRVRGQQTATQQSQQWEAAHEASGVHVSQLRSRGKVSEQVIHHIFTSIVVDFRNNSLIYEIMISAIFVDNCLLSSYS